MKGIGPFLSCFALLALAAAGARSDGGVREAQRRDEIDDKQFQHLRHGSNRTEALMAACFKLENRKDQKDMLAILEEVRQSFVFGHPLAESIGIRARYDPRRFPGLEDGMPGTGDEYEDGLAGGHAFDDELPALPYGGPNMDELLNPKRLPR